MCTTLVVRHHQSKRALAAFPSKLSLEPLASACDWPLSNQRSSPKIGANTELARRSSSQWIDLIIRTSQSHRHMNMFDHTQLNDAAIRAQYERLLRRGTSIAEAVHSAYGRNRKPIQMAYAADPEFNAFAREADQHYQVHLTSSVPALVMLLFYKLFENPNLMPEISTEGMTASDFSLSFIVDPADFAQRQDWQIKLNRQRAFAARILADICTTFVITHEFGHIVSGHAEGANFLEGEPSYMEMLAGAPRVPQVLERRQAWEVDADAVGATLLTHYLVGLEQHTQDHEDVAAAFFRDGDTRAHILSASIAALMALFSYIRGTRYRLKLQSSHPHPMVRAFYVKDMLITAIRDQWDFDLETMLSLMDTRLDEMLDALHALGLSNNAAFTDAYIDELNAERDRVMALRRTHRQACAEWSWISWTGADE